MGLMVELGQFLGRDLDAVRKGGFGVEFDPGEDRFTCVAFLQKADRFVRVGLQSELLEGAEGEEGEHMAAGEGSHKGLLGVGEFGVAEVVGGGGGLNGHALTEVEVVIARVFLVAEGTAAAVPVESNTVVGHDVAGLEAGRSIGESSVEVKGELGRSEVGGRRWVDTKSPERGGAPDFPS